MSGDLPGCIATLRAVHRADGYPSRWPVDPAGWLSPDGMVEAWVAQRAGVVVGHVCVVGGIDDPLAASRAGIPIDRLAGVSRLFVAPTARGDRLGAALLGCATSWAAENGLRVVLDVVDDASPARSLYERTGWHLVDHRIAEWTTPGGIRPRMAVYLSP